MDLESLTKAAHESFAGAILAEEGVPDDLALVLHAESCPHPMVPNAMLPSAWSRDGDRLSLDLYAGSLPDDVDLDTLVASEVWAATADHAAQEALPSDDALLEAHARFRADEPLMSLWHRAGERLAPFVWVVDIDLFVELRVLPGTWQKLCGDRVTLNLLDASFDVEIPTDAGEREVLTLEGAGLAEENVDADAPDGTGDMHLLPFVF